MASFFVPAHPRYTFPRLSGQKTLEELLQLCNSVLDDFAPLVDACKSDVRRALTGGQHKARLWALHQVRQAYDRQHTLEVRQYFADLEQNRQAAIENPMVRFLHSSVIDGLAVKAEQGMPEASRSELVTAMWAVLNCERDAERGARAAVANRGPSKVRRAKLAERSQRDRDRTLATKGGTNKR